MIVLLQTSWSGLDGSYCRTSPGSSGVQLECLMKPKMIGCIHFFALREKTKLSPSCGRAPRLKKIKESLCGLGLAQNKDRQNNLTYNVDLQKKKNMGKRVLTWIFHSGRRAREDTCWRCPFPERLAFQSHL